MIKKNKEKNKNKKFIANSQIYWYYLKEIEHDFVFNLLKVLYPNSSHRKNMRIVWGMSAQRACNFCYQLLVLTRLSFV